MKRLLFFCSVLLLTGLYLGYFLSKEAIVLAIFIASVSGILKAVISRSFYLRIAALFLSCSFIVGMISIPYCDISKDAGLSTGEKASLTLRVSEPPEINEDYSIFVCDLLSKDGESFSSGFKIRLFHQSTKSNLSLGDVFVATCEITEPGKALNRGDFDYGLYLKTKGIFVSGQITDKNVTLLSENNYTIKDRFKLLNMRLCDSIDENFKDSNSIFLKAVLLGEKADMPPSYYQDLKRSGLSHVATVSGMHLSYIILILSFFMKMFKIKKRIFSAFTIAISICFMLLTGMSPSVTRAAIMVIFMFSGDLFVRRSDSLTSMGLSAMIIVLFNPYVAFSTSFILSYAATTGILIMTEPLGNFLIPKNICLKPRFYAKLLKGIFAVLAVSISAQLFSLVFSVFIFREFSLWALITNLLITPLLPIILGAGLLFCIFSVIYMPLTMAVAKVLALPVSLAQGIINFFGNLNFGNIIFGKLGILFIFAYISFLMIILLILYKKPKFSIFPASLLLISVIFAITQSIALANTSKVTFINVGHGDCTLITLPHDINILIDGGDTYVSEDKDTSQTTVNSYLRKNGIKDIDFMVATHANADHTGGLVDVMDNFDVGALLIPPGFSPEGVSATLINKATKNNIPVYTMTTGDNISFDDRIKLTALMPDSCAATSFSGSNNSSLVMRLDLYDTSFIFMGDCEAEAERYMLRLLEDDVLDIDVLKVGHHGSITSTTEAFLERTSPQFAFIPCPDNSFSHPSGEVLKRLSKVGTTVFRADLNKDVIFVLTTDGISNIIYS